MAAILKRWKIILPSEHGSWTMLLTPFVIGAGVAGRWPITLWLCAIAVLALFLARQPLGLLVRVLRGKARYVDGPAAWFWSSLLIATAGGAGIGLLALGCWQIVWLAIPAAVALSITLALGVWLGPRRLGIELIGVTGLALATPAAYVAATGVLNSTAWLTGLVSAIHGAISILYVRMRIDQKHQRASDAERIGVIAMHALALAIVVEGAFAGWLPPLVILPIGLLLLRALYTGWRQPPVKDVRRFGLTETGFALAFAAIVILAFTVCVSAPGRPMLK